MVWRRALTASASTTSAGSCSTSTARSCTAAGRPRPPAAGRGGGAGAHPRLRAAAGAVHQRQPCRAGGDRPRAARGRPAVGDDEVLTPIESAITYLRRRHRQPGARCSPPSRSRERMARGRHPARPTGEEAEVVFVAHVDEVDLASLERAARAVTRGAPLLTGSYVPRLRGRQRHDLQPRRDGHRGDRQGHRRAPEIVGKPSRAAVAEVARASRPARPRARRDRRRPRDGHRARTAGRLAHGARAQRDQRPDRPRPRPRSAAVPTP